MLIGGYEGEPVAICLGNKESVEGIAMVERESFHSIGVAGRDRQEPHSPSLQSIEEVGWSIELAEARLDRNLPDHYGAHYNLAPASDRLSGLPANPIFFSRHPPEDDVGVEQKGQGCMPRESARSSGNSSKSSAIRTRPRQAPAREAKP
jgi:hypothetical protein